MMHEGPFLGALEKWFCAAWWNPRDKGEQISGVRSNGIDSPNGFAA